MYQPQVGDRVQLQSGGAVMTVINNAWTQTGEVFVCAWTDDAKQPHQLQCRAAALKKALPDPADKLPKA